MQKPKVTVSYAQTINGSIAQRSKERLFLSCPEALKYTHELRAANDGILVGINTVLIDDPLLTVRLVSGSNPRPIIIDSELKLPLGAKVLVQNPMKPWIFVKRGCGSQEKHRLLIDQGAEVFQLDPTIDGYLDINEIMRILRERQISTLLVEGGKRIITQFLSQKIADEVIVTISPQFVAGLNAIDDDRPVQIEVAEVTTRILGRDVVLKGMVVK